MTYFKRLPHKALGTGYGVVYCDPPWPMYGDPNKDAAAGKHYNLMSMQELCALLVPGLMADRCAVFMWATCPRLNLAFELMDAWGLHYRGVAFVWVKTRKDGGWIAGQGVPPTATKPTSELCLLGTTNKRGRPHPLLDAAVPQVVPAPRTGKHSQKPAVFYDLIERLYGTEVPRIELFARNTRPGWDAWGNEAPELKQ